MTDVPPQFSPAYYQFASNDTEAEERANAFQNVDPFEDIPPSLLSSEHVADYVRVTALMHPFYPVADRLKPASYEARARRFIRWDNDGRKILTDVEPGTDQRYVLPENSITFVQIESKIRLPEYIALRFNLRIKHVHRGLLLGTGPLVDPGFRGDLLIPLHNLTAEKYSIAANEGIIWIEFTKTTHNPKRWPPDLGEFFPIQTHKTDVPFQTYFERANHNNPIQSSIPSSIKVASEQARAADASARKANRTIRVLAGIGFLAIAGLVLGATSIAVSVVKDSTQASEDARRAVRETETMKKDSTSLAEQLADLQRQLENLSRRPPPAPPGVGTPGNVPR